MSQPRAFDFLVIGAGMAGMSSGSELAAHGQVAVLEREANPGTQTTGQSAALFIASYGAAEVRPLNRISRRFFDEPPQGFCETPILSPRPLLYVAHESEPEALVELEKDIGGYIRRVGRDEILAQVPILRPEHATMGFCEDDSCDIDVMALLRGYERTMKARGGELVLGANIRSVLRDSGRWLVETDGARYSAAVVVNAAGAWADEVAMLAGAAPLGLEPKRRSAYTADVPKASEDPRFAGFLDWPCVVNESTGERGFYFKPEGGQLMMSPGNEDPSAAIRDVQPEYEDGAIVQERFNAATAYEVRRFATRRAGLRTFTSDGAPAIGFDAKADGFFWLAGQGGWGIQAAPAAAQLTAALASRSALPDAFSGYDHERLSPRRLTRAG